MTDSAITEPVQFVNFLPQPRNSDILRICEPLIISGVVSIKQKFFDSLENKNILVDFWTNARDKYSSSGRWHGVPLTFLRASNTKTSISLSFSGSLFILTICKFQYTYRVRIGGLEFWEGHENQNGSIAVNPNTLGSFFQPLASGSVRNFSQWFERLVTTAGPNPRDHIVAYCASLLGLAATNAQIPEDICEVLVFVLYHSHYFTSPANTKRILVWSFGDAKTVNLMQKQITSCLFPDSKRIQWKIVTQAKKHKAIASFLTLCISKHAVSSRMDTHLGPSVGLFKDRKRLSDTNDTSVLLEILLDIVKTCHPASICSSFSSILLTSLFEATDPIVTRYLQRIIRSLYDKMPYLSHTPIYHARYIVNSLLDFFLFIRETIAKTERISLAEDRAPAFLNILLRIVANLVEHMPRSLVIMKEREPPTPLFFSRLERPCPPKSPSVILPGPPLRTGSSTFAREPLLTHPLPMFGQLQPDRANSMESSLCRSGKVGPSIRFSSSSSSLFFSSTVPGSGKPSNGRLPVESPVQINPLHSRDFLSPSASLRCSAPSFNSHLVASTSSSFSRLTARDDRHSFFDHSKVASTSIVEAKSSQLQRPMPLSICPNCAPVSGYNSPGVLSPSKAQHASIGSYHSSLTPPFSPSLTFFDESSPCDSDSSSSSSSSSPLESSSLVLDSMDDCRSDHNGATSLECFSFSDKSILSADTNPISTSTANSSFTIPPIDFPSSLEFDSYDSEECSLTMEQELYVKKEYRQHLFTLCKGLFSLFWEFIDHCGDSKRIVDVLLSLCSTSQDSLSYCLERCLRNQQSSSTSQKIVIELTNKLICSLYERGESLSYTQAKLLLRRYAMYLTSLNKDSGLASLSFVGFSVASPFWGVVPGSLKSLFLKTSVSSPATQISDRLSRNESHWDAEVRSVSCALLESMKNTCLPFRSDDSLM